MVEGVYERCCGLDVHKDTVVACLITPGPDGQPQQEIRTFGTMTDDLLALADWLRARQCRRVGLEATGSYWKPLWNLLEDEFDLLLVNARHMKPISVHYPYGEHGLFDGHGRGHGSGPSVLWADLAAAGDQH